MSKFTLIVGKARLMLVALCTWLVWGGLGPVIAQELVTSTPVRVELPTLAPPVIESAVTATPSRTPTPEGQVLLEAKPDAGDVNVRAEPDISAERLGSIRAGRTYQVLGRYFRWLQFQYDDAPAGPVRGWVFDELVDVIGDLNAIPNLQPDGSAPQATNVGPEEVLRLTPGGALTATASVRVLTLPGAELSSSGAQQSVARAAGEESAVQPLPTFTYPADLAILALNAAGLDPLNDASARSRPANSLNSLPPIGPIVLLGAIGLLGLAVSSLRR
ncbi:MAG: SH3 domain-containing protein [Aggregatilineales bacterium]